MPNVTIQAILSVVRTLLIAFGTYLFGAGWDSSSGTNVDEIIGALTIILTAAWGIWQKYQASHREVVALNAGIIHADNTAGTTPPVPASDAQKVIEENKDAVAMRNR